MSANRRQNEGVQAFDAFKVVELDREDTLIGRDIDVLHARRERLEDRQDVFVESDMRHRSAPRSAQWRISLDRRLSEGRKRGKNTDCDGEIPDLSAAPAF